MGFPLVSYCLAVPKPVVAFCKLLSVIRDAVMLMLAVFGLCRFPFDDDSRRSALAADAPRPEEVKAQLPAVEYAQLRSACHPDSSEEATCCIVCLEMVDASDEVRRLGNCAHAFHRGCIDRWMEHDQRTCPLCRAPLIPDEMAGAPLWAAAAGVPDAYDFDLSYFVAPVAPSPAMLRPHELLLTGLGGYQ